MKILLMSDTHGMHSSMSVPEGMDMVIHAGDFMNGGRDLNELIAFRDWFSRLAIRHKIVIAGNHDIIFDATHRYSNPYQAEKARSILTEGSGITYLQDELIEVGGLKIYGSPWTPEFMGWGFNVPRGEEIRRIWEKIPPCDVLVTHGPPYGILDKARPMRGGDALGCDELMVKVNQINPKLHVFGHIHGSRGVTSNTNTVYINASFVKENYVPYSSDAYYIWSNDEVHHG